MKDIVKSIILPQTEIKPVHGHTRIVLTNSASGHIIKDIESENTFQSQVLADLFDNIPFLNQQNNRSWSDMVGGLLLFRDSIPVGSRFMPAGNVMIGNGYRDATNSSTPLELGSFNSIDSYARFNQQTGKPVIYQVWDFNNNQANGRISSVCLTSKIGGAIGYGNASGSRRNTDWTLRSFSQDDTKWNEMFDDSDTTYRFYVNADSTVTVTEIRRTAVEGSAFSGLSGSYTLTPSSTISGDIVAGYVNAHNVGNHKIRFVPHGGRTYASGTSVPYYEFDTQTKSLEIKTFTNNYTGSIVTKKSVTYYYSYCTFVFTRTGKVICKSSNGLDLVVFDLSDSSYKLIHKDGYAFVNAGESIYDAGEIAENLYIACATGSGNVYLVSDFVNNTTYLCNSNTGAFAAANACNDKGMTEVISKSNGEMGAKYIFPNPLYLATINNITPVQKDATLTMRVMYTLEEA